MKDAPAVQLADAVDLREVVADAGGDQELAGPDDLVVGERDVESRVGVALRGASRRRCAARPCRTVRARARPIAQKLLRVDAVARQVPVQRVRGGVARVAGVAHEHRPPAPAENERRAQPSRTCPHNHDVVRLRHCPLERDPCERSEPASEARSAEALTGGRASRPSTEAAIVIARNRGSSSATRDRRPRARGRR